jgi:hypothetical protein
VRKGALLEVTATNSITNREVEQRQWMGMFQLLNQHSMSVLQLAGAIDPELFQQLVIEAIKTSGEATARLLSTFNEVDVERLILGYNMFNGGQNGAQGGPPGANGAPAMLGAGPGGVPPGGQQQGLGGLLGGLGGPV